VTALVGESGIDFVHRRIAKGGATWTAAHRVDSAAFAFKATPAMTVVAGDPVFAWVANTPDRVVVASVCR